MENKKQEQEQYIKEYNQAIERVEKLITALLDYKKDNINVKFFEYYFTQRYTAQDIADEYIKSHKIGEIVKDWKGKTKTDFYFSDKQYNFEKGKRIYLANSQYIENIETPNRKNLILLVDDKITQLKNNRDYCIKKRDIYKNFELGNFKEEYKKLLEKYNGEEISYDIIDEIKHI